MSGRGLFQREAGLATAEGGGLGSGQHVDAWFGLEGPDGGSGLGLGARSNALALAGHVPPVFGPWRKSCGTAFAAAPRARFPARPHTATPVAMEMTTPALVLAVLPHGEHGAVVRFLTPLHGLVAGYVRGGRSRRLRPVLAIGNAVVLHLQSRHSWPVLPARISNLAPKPNNGVRAAEFMKEARRGGAEEK